MRRTLRKPLAFLDVVNLGWVDPKAKMPAEHAADRCNAIQVTALGSAGRFHAFAFRAHCAPQRGQANTFVGTLTAIGLRTSCGATRTPRLCPCHQQRSLAIMVKTGCRLSCRRICP